MPLHIPNKQALMANIDPADLADLIAEAEALSENIDIAEALEAQQAEAAVTSDWHYTLPVQYQV